MAHKKTEKMRTVMNCDVLLSEELKLLLELGTPSWRSKKRNIHFPV
jgi:hypothetical protein